MIAKPIGTARDSGGLIRYLFGRTNGHENQRTIAGTTQSIEVPTRELIDQVADDLRTNARLFDQPKAGHVQHIVIALNPGDRARTDVEWKAITEDYLTARGITDPNKAGVKWTAVHHGRNAAGADHVHIALSIVRNDGTRVNTFQDIRRSQKWAAAAEKRYDLIPLESRVAQTGAKSLTRYELKKAADTGREPTRVRLADMVRPIAAASTSELDYVQRLREAGLNPKPRIEKDTGRITGYSVALEGERFGGGTVSPELKLPALRRSAWEQSNTRAAAQEWAHPTPRSTFPNGKVAGALDQVLADAHRTMTPAEHRAWSAQAAGLTAAAAASTSDPVKKQELRSASRDIARWAGPTDHRPARASRNALQVVAAAFGGSKERNELMDAVDDVGRIVKAHRASRPGIAAQPKPPVPMAQQTVAPSLAPPTPVPVQSSVRPVVRRQQALRIRR